MSAADADIATGHAICSCGHSWWLSDESLMREAQFQAEYMEAEVRDITP
jgi:hypothetical protein